MGKVKGYPQERLRAQFATFIRTNARLLTAVVTFLLIIVGLGTFFIWSKSPHTMLTGYVLGAIHVGAIASIFYTLRMTFFASDGSAIHQLRGSLGESNTRDELKRAQRRRIIWGWVDSIAVQGGDIDHLVITRQGGLVAVDSKWRSNVKWGEVQASAEAADRARRRASMVLRHLKYMSREHQARHRDEIVAVTVAPLVVVWGSAQKDVPAGAKIEDVPFVAGRALLEWLRSVEGSPIDRRSAKHLQRDLENFRDVRAAKT